MHQFSRIILIAVAAIAVSPASAGASHSWGSYHWGFTSTPVVVGLDNNLTTVGWQAIGADSSADWTAPPPSAVQWDVLDAPLTAPKTDNKRCKASAGRVEVCNGRYGSNGWLGLAQIWLSGGHIVQGTAKMNDTYLASSSYDATARQHVLCQEVGHTFGLGHVDESGADFDTCMDYSDKLDNPSPNDHDFEQLATIYTYHQDAKNTAASPAAGSATMRRVRDDVWLQDFGGGRKIYTFVFWADRSRPHGPPEVGH